MFFLGTTKQLLRLFFFSTNHKAAYYLLDEVEKINNVLKTTLFPSDFPRTQQSITFYATYKATEFRNLVFYSLIFILNGHMKDKYYVNIVKYICFIRLLTKEKINPEDIIKAKQLINEFCPEFENLYGTTNMSYNLHVQLHLAEQCELIGGLHMASCFAGESCFNECSQRFYGTTNIPYQIAKNINLKRQIYEYLTLDEINKSIISLK